jgi:hypothetical protein
MFLFVLAVFHAETTSAQTLTARVTYPMDGAVGADLSKPIEWGAVANAQAYQLYVGSTPGASDLVNSRQLQTTSFPWNNVPPGQRVFARIWVQVGGVWRYTDSSFSGTQVRTHILYPLNGAVNADSGRPIQWASVPNAQAYQLWLGSAAGGRDLLLTTEIQVTSVAWSNVPANQPVFARIWVQIGGAWSYTDSSFSGLLLTSHLTFPADGAVGVDPAKPIQWASVPDAQAYQLYLGSSPGARNILDTRQTKTTSATAPYVPLNQVVYARIWVQVGGVWRFTDSSFGSIQLTSSITYPVKGAANADLSQPIRWTSVPNAQAYVLWIGSTAGSNDLVTTSEALQTSYLAANLPAAQTVYARIWVKVADAWRPADSSFTVGSILPAITVPGAGATDVDAKQPIRWTTAANVQAQVLWLGSAVGARDLASSLEGMQTSFVASNLSSGQNVFARLWTKVGSLWAFRDSQFKIGIGSLKATMLYPTDGLTGVDSTRPFSWTSVPNSQAYFLWVGTAADTHDVVSSGDLTQTTFALSGLPFGTSLLHVTIWCRVGNVWSASRSTFRTSAAAGATFLNPLDGHTLVDLTEPVRWTSVTADAYVLAFGRQQGSFDLLKTPELRQTSYLASQLPVSGTVYGRLSTRIDSTWWYQDISFGVIPYAPRFVYPTQGDTAVNLGRAFEWTASQAADAYRLWIGTSPGASDLATADVLNATSYAASDLPADRLLYARIFSRVAGHFSRYTDIAFTLATANLHGGIVYPPDGSTAADGGQPFEWAANNLAQAYQLRVGSTAGGSDLHDSGAIRVTRRFVDALPLGVTLFGRLSTRLDGEWHDSDFTFKLATNVTTTATRISNGLWATSVVRAMTPAMTNRPYGWTPLWDTIEALKYEASCGAYTAALHEALVQMNLGLPIRNTMIRFSQIDVHIFVEILDSDTSQWMILDPTFGLAARRTADGGWASAADIASSAVIEDWSAIHYVFLSPQNDAIARGYYLDYPLLFINDFVIGSPWHSAAPYLTEVSVPVSGPFGVFIATCDQGNQADILTGVAPRTIQCASDGLSGAFLASSVAAPPGSTQNFQLYQPRRFVF